MKKKTITGLMLTGILLITFAFKSNKLQSGGNSGIYLTVMDFYNQRLSFAFDCNSNNGKLTLNEMLGSSSGSIVSNGEKHAFDKTKAYGYRNCDSKIYRFFGKGEYQILDTSDFYIYYRYEQVEKVKGKGLVKTDEYFFSKNAESPIQLLTIENLKKAFPDNLPFHYAIDAHFRNDQELIAYDSYFKGYKLKYLYNQSLK
ncbi:MAG TPA: hypothetical protein VGZ90_07865 [Puia sp.]|jgi:hypothetical protein|nr:hypothetical protein [Puia sp.]